jgi:4-amino-4-deoxy-L-arabinose transferase-like glycosyltransferase
MPKLSSRVLWGTVVALIAVQSLLTVLTIRRESLTFDEGNHMFAGFMMLHNHDYGLNPEHPPLVKYLAALPTIGRTFWIPENKNRPFKTESYVDGGEWVAHNDGDRNQLVFQMRMAAGILVPLFALVVFLTARECFGDWAGLIALTLLVFDPNVLGNAALVTTDIGISFFFIAATWCFYRYVKQPTWTRLLIASVITGLLLASKHSAVLFAPMMLLLIAYEVSVAPKVARPRTALRLSGGFCVIMTIGVMVLWSFYGFRYAARPAPLKMMSDSLTNSVGVVRLVSNMHLLPESYLIGLVDVRRMATFYSAFIFGRNWPHGVWWYFPSVFAIKTTLGLLALTLLTIIAIAARKHRLNREFIFMLVPALLYFLVAILFGMNIGSRHLLPFYGYLFILAGAGAAALASNSRRWLFACAFLVAAHVASSMAVYPNFMAYANEAFGGPSRLPMLLSDANVEWGQQLFEVKKWQDRHPNEECWFAYFVYPEIRPETYGIRCHHLPNAGTIWAGEPELIPPVVEGAVLLSASDLVATESPDAGMNPYVAFESMKPDEVIDYGIMIFHGRFDMRKAAAQARMQMSLWAMRKHNPAYTLQLAQEAVALDPDLLTNQTALGDALAANGRKDEARQAWQIALSQAHQLEPATQLLYVPRLEAKLSK